VEASCGSRYVRVLFDPPLNGAKKPRRGATGDETPLGSSHDSGLDAHESVAGHDIRGLGDVEHCGQNQWAHRQPHRPLHSFPPTIAPRETNNRSDC
jgi:hypothetical protein